MKKQKQPTPRKGYSFTGWAVFNWGISYDRVFRTRKQAQESCWKGSNYVRNGKIFPALSWNNVKDHMKVVKVKCSVL